MPLITPGSSIQSAINANPDGTAFCLGAGTHTISAPIVPKNGNTFTGQLGAIVDGTGWASSDLDDAAFKALNVNIDDVTIKNLVIRNMPSYGVNAYRDFSDRWTVEYCEIHNCRNGVSLPHNSICRRNYIHHCEGDRNSLIPAERGGGYSYNGVNGGTFEYNRIAYCGIEQKFLLCTGLTIRHNLFDNNVADGLWFDGKGDSSIVEFNTCDDNGRTGITLELATALTAVRYNLVRRNATSGILLTVSRNIEVYENTLEDNKFSLDLFMNCPSLDEGHAWNPDLRDNYIHHNAVRVPNISGAYGAIMTIVGSCGANYISNAKNNDFDHNMYDVPNLAGSLWHWGGTNKTFAQWQALPQDENGSLS